MKEKKENKILDICLDTIWNLMTITLILVFVLICYTIIDNNTMLLKKNKRMEHPYLTEYIEVEIAKKDIETNTDNATGATISTNYFYFYYDDKLKRCEVDPGEYEYKRVGSKIRVKVEIQYSKTTGYTMSESYKYLR